MSSQDVFDLCLDFVEEFYGVYGNEALFVLQMLEPLRDGIEQRLGDFVETTMSWRDYAGSAFEDLPDFLNPQNPDYDTISGPFKAGVESVSNPTVMTVGFGTFEPGQIIRITDASPSENNALFEVLWHMHHELTIRGVGKTTVVEIYTNRNFVAGTTSGGTITLLSDTPAPDTYQHPEEQFPNIFDPKGGLIMQSNIDIADMARRLEALENLVKELDPVAFAKLARDKKRRGKA